jgi:hypothetical protein
MQHLAALAGMWHGTGRGRYPTIAPFEYSEALVVEVDLAYPLMHYEQRTVLQPGDEAGHWESGFIRPLEDGQVEMSSAQDSGRVEVLRGHVSVAAPQGWEMQLDSVVLGHDPRLVQTRRVFTLTGDELRYVKYMATHTTPEPVLQQHLEALLYRGRP